MSACNAKRLTAGQLRAIALADAAADEARNARAGVLRRRNLEAALKAGIFGSKTFSSTIAHALEVGAQS